MSRSRAVRLGWPVGAGIGATGPLPLSPLVLMDTDFTVGDVAGTVIGLILGKTTGSALSLVNDNGGAVALSSTSLVVGLAAPSTPGTFTVTLRETLAGSSNSPRDTVLTITVNSAVALALNFAQGPLDPRVTYSRTTPAMEYDKTGLLTWAPNNLVRYSGDLTHPTYWGLNGSAVPNNLTTAPDGTQTALQVTSGRLSYFDASLYPNGGTFIASVYIKGTAGQLVGVGHYHSGIGDVSTADFTLDGSWQRLSQVFTVPSGTGDNRFIIRMSGDAYFSASNISVWHPQVERVTYQTTPRAYLPTTSSAVYGARFDHNPATATRNLLTYSNDFTNTVWTTFNNFGGSSPVRVANAGLAPDGTNTATLITVDRTAGSDGWSMVKQALIVAPGAYTGTMYLKAYAAADVGKVIGLTINNGSGTFFVKAVTLTSEWSRHEVTGTASATATGEIIIGHTSTSIGGPTPTGQVQFLAAQAQLEQSGFAGPYVPTTTAPRQDFAEPLGLLVEEQRANLILRSQEFNSAPWEYHGLSGTAVVANAILAPDGTLTADKLEEDGTNSEHRIYQPFNFPSASSGVWSIYAKAGERSWVSIRNGGGAQVANFNLATGTLGSKTAGATASITPAGNGWFRCTMSCAVGGVGEFFTINIGDVDTGVGPGYSYTGVTGNGIYLWGAQPELGTFPTSYIPTVASSVTRAADVASMTGTNFSSWYNQAAGTFVVEADTFSPVSLGTGLINVNQDGNNFISIDANGNRVSYVNIGASAPVDLSPGGVVQNGSAKFGSAYALNDFAAVISGGTVLTDTSGALPTPNKLQIGIGSQNINYLNGHIKSITYYNTRKTNVELQALTTYTPDIDWDLTTALPTGAVFSRTTPAMMTDSTGKLTWAPNNLVPQMFHTLWNTSFTSVAAAATTAPDGTLTAASVTGTTGTGGKRIFVGASATGNMIWSIYVKAGTQSIVQLLHNTDGEMFANFNVATGTVGTKGTKTTATVTDAGNGWFRISAAFSGITSSGSVMIYFTDSASSGYGGGDTSGLNTFYVWGAQAEAVTYQTLPRPYIPTTSAAVYGARFDYAVPVVTNLLTYSNEFTNAAWTKPGLTLTANAATGPDGTLSATFYPVNTGADNTQYLQQRTSSAAGLVTATFYVKPKGYRWVALSIYDVNHKRSWFDLTNGVVGTAASGSTTSIESVGDGWFRIRVTHNTEAAASYINLIASDANNSVTVTGSAGDGLYIYGAQLEQSATARVYVPTTTTPASVSLPPVAKGLLIEEQRANLVPYSANLQTWEADAGAGSLSTNATTATPDGTVSAVFTASGIWNSAQYYQPMAQGTYTCSVWLRGSGTVRLSVMTNGYAERGATEVTLTSTWTRYTATGTTTGSDTLGGIRLAKPGGSAVSMEAWGAQLEVGSFATSYIPTTSSAVTRAADSCTVSGAAFASWWTGERGTIVWKGDTAGVGTSAAGNRGLYSINDGTGNNRIDNRPFDSAIHMLVSSGGVGSASLFTGTFPANTVVSTVTSFAKDDFAYSRAGSAAITDTSGAVPVGLNQLLLGNLDGGGYALAGHISRFQFYKRKRLPNSTLQRISA